MHQSWFTFGVIPGAAVFADAMAARPTVVGRTTERGPGGVLLKLFGHSLEPLLPDGGIRLAELCRARVGVTISLAIRLKSKQLRLRFVKAIPPIGKAMPTTDFERSQLQPLQARPVVGLAVALVAEDGEIEGATTGTNLRMVAVFEWFYDDGIRVLVRLHQVLRPQPAYAEVILEEGVDGVDRSVFLLLAVDFFIDALDHEVIGVPAVATGDDQMVAGGSEKDFLRMLKGKIDIGQQSGKFRVHAQPDRAFRQGVGSAVEKLRPGATDFFDVVRQFIGGLSGVGRGILEHNQGCHGNVDGGIDENKVALGGGDEGKPGESDEKRMFHGRSSWVASAEKRIESGYASAENLSKGADLPSLGAMKRIVLLVGFDVPVAACGCSRRGETKHRFYSHRQPRRLDPGLLRQRGHPDA